MDLWDSYKKVAFEDFNKKQLLLCTGDRHHTSLSMIQDRAMDLPVSVSMAQNYSEGRRYIIARNINYDIFISVYNVNTRAIVVTRFTRIPKPEDWKRILKRIKSWGKTNIELRAIGFQNGSTELIGILESFQRAVDGHYMEIDLFGTEIRHIAIDLKTGTSYNLLPLNRIYRPGELACQLKPEEYDATRSDLVIK